MLAGSRGLRRWQRVDGTWQRERSSGPAGVAAGWAVVYGAAALVLGALALRWWPAAPADGPSRAESGARPRVWSEVWSVEWVVAGLVVFAALLMVVSPLWMLAVARRTMYARVEESLGRQAVAAARWAAGHEVPRPDESPSGQAAWLEAHGRAYSAVVRRRGRDAGLTMRTWAVRPPTVPPSAVG